MVSNLTRSGLYWRGVTVLRKVLIERFRGFRHFEADLSPISAFLGPNSSGKTTVLQAVRFACEALNMAVEHSDKLEAIKSNFRQGEFQFGEFRLNDFRQVVPLSNIEALFVDQIVGDNLTFKIILVFEESDPVSQCQVVGKWGRNEQLMLTVSFRAKSLSDSAATGHQRRRDRLAQINEFISSRAPLAILVPPFYGTIHNEEYRAQAVIDRLLGSGDQSHVVRNLIAALDSTQFNLLNTILRETIKAELTYRTTGDRLQSESPLVVRFKDTNGDIELSAAGAGLTNLISLFASLSRWRLASEKRSLIYLLDEPEAHLHPRLQTESVDQLAGLVTKEFGAQLLIATHSVDILNRLSLAQRASLLRCDRSATPSVVQLTTDSQLFDDLASWADLTPYTAINFLASRRVLFCEGVSDRKILTAAARLKFRNDLKRLGKFHLWSIVCIDGIGNKKLSDLLVRLVRSDVIKAQAKEGAFQVILARDRDSEAQFANETKLIDGVEETIRTWSRNSLESLFLEPSILLSWFKAVLPEPPSQLEQWIENALAGANMDSELNQWAEAMLLVRFKRESPSQEGEERILVRAHREAHLEVSKNPETWQRGKDRAKYILHAIRKNLPHASRRRVPSNLADFLVKADQTMIADTQKAIPFEVSELFELMTRDPVSP